MWFNFLELCALTSFLRWRCFLTSCSNRVIAGIVRKKVCLGKHSWENNCFWTCGRVGRLLYQVPAFLHDCLHLKVSDTWNFTLQKSGSRLPLQIVVGHSWSSTFILFSKSLYKLNCLTTPSKLSNPSTFFFSILLSLRSLKMFLLNKFIPVKLQFQYAMYSHSEYQISHFGFWITVWDNWLVFKHGIYFQWKWYVFLKRSTLRHIHIFMCS